MVKLILATDMAKHKDLVDTFQKYLPVFDFKNRDHLENVVFLIFFVINLKKTRTLKYDFK